MGLAEILSSMASEMSGVAPSQRLMGQITGGIKPQAGFGANMDTVNWLADLVNNAAGTAGPALGYAKALPKVLSGVREVVTPLPKYLKDESGLVGDKNSKNIKVYHGTTRDFPTEEIKTPAFFTSDRERAYEMAEKRRLYAGEENPKTRIIETNIKFDNPYIIDAKNDFAGNYQFGPKSSGYRKALEDKKYDGIIIKNTRDEGDVYILKDKKSLKSAKEE